MKQIHVFSDGNIATSKVSGRDTIQVHVAYLEGKKEPETAETAIITEDEDKQFRRANLSKAKKLELANDIIKKEDRQLKKLKKQEVS